MLHTKGWQMFGEEIVLEIDQTLDQLIHNAETISHVDLKELSETELEAFQKTQESLLQHLMHMDQFIQAKHKNIRVQDKRSASAKIQEKLQRFKHLESSYQLGIADRQACKPIICKRRAKRFFDLRSRMTCRAIAK